MNSMNPDPFHSVARLFEAVRGLGPTERAARLAEADAAIRGEVAELLVHHDSDGSVLAEPGEFAPGRPGDVVAGYRLLSEVGAGSMGRVFLAERGNRRFAVKLIHPHVRSGRSAHERFEREAAIGRRVVHANVVRTHDAGVADDREYLVMDFVEGQTLDALLTEMTRVPEQLARHIAREVAAGLGAIHRVGAVHRDVKPSNVLITPANEVKVMDLGVAYLTGEAAKLSMTGAFLGSVAYAAPEQFGSRDAELDGRADLFSLGVLLYELVTGEHPFTDDDLPRTIQRILTASPRRVGRLNPQVSPYFEEVVHTLLSKEREARFVSADELCDVLDAGESGGWWGRRARELRRESGRPLRRISVPRDTDVYGRDAEMTTLRTVFDRAAAGDGQVALLEGEAGIGKTRLVDELVGRLHREGLDFQFLCGSYPPGGAGVDAGAFAHAYLDHLGEQDLEATLERYLSATPSLIPSFAAMLRRGIVPDGAPALGPEALRTVCVHLTRELANERTTVLLVDDLHFASESARGLFAALALAAPRHRLLLIGTTRPMAAQRWTSDLERLQHATAVRLQRLGPNDLAELLIDAFRSERLARELSFKIAQKSDGNPFFALEIVRGLKEGQFIRRGPDGSWASTRLIEDITIPESVSELMRARISDLDEEDQELLEVAACCGFEFRADWLAETLGLARIPLLRKLGKIERTHRVVRAAGPQFVFDHHQIQEALYAGLSQPLREEYHAALAESLERTTAAPREAATETRICRHYLFGRRGPSALPYLETALTHLKSLARHRDAVEITTRALAEPGLVSGTARCDLLLRHADHLNALGLREAQRAACDEAIGLADDPATRVLALLARSVYLRVVSEYEQAIADAEEAVRIATDAGDRGLQIRALRAHAYVLPKLGRLREAVALQERCAALARDEGDEDGETIARDDLSTVLSLLGEHERAFELKEQVLRHRERGSDKDVLAASLVNIAHVAQRLNRFQDALDFAGRGLELAQQVGNRLWAANACMSLGNISQNMGRYEDARAWQERGLEMTIELGNRDGEAGTLINLGGIASFLGERERAADLLERGRRICREIGHRQFEAVAIANLASVVSSKEESLALRLEALELNREMGQLPGVAGALLSIGEIEIQLGRPESAAARFDEALELGRQMNDGMLILGAAALRTALPGADVPAALDALAKYRDATRRPALVQALHMLWRATGDEQHLVDAREILLELQAALPPEKQAQFLESDSLHREIVADWDELHPDA